MTSTGLWAGQDQLKPIETRYNGGRYRSRKEARFAVFLDALAIPYVPEPEGYRIGARYLPDFELPQTQAFIEIKGVTPTTQEFWKAMRLALLSGRPVGIFWADFQYPDFVEQNYAFYRDSSGIFHSKRGDALHLLGWQCAFGLFDALDAARSARFEFGERG